MAKKSLECRF